MAVLNGWRLTRAGVVFVLGIVLLGALVFGGIWFVKERGEQARRDEAIKVAEAQLEEQSEVNQTPIAEEAQNNGSTNAPTTGTTQATTVELPATGAEAGHIVAIAALAIATSYYAASRRATQRG